MRVTVSDVMRRVRNYFPSGYVEGAFTATSGVLSPNPLGPGEWVAIPDGPWAGVYQADALGRVEALRDGTWQGRMFLLSPPEDFLRLCGEISAWAGKKSDPTVVSEKFGEYSRTQSSPAWEKVFSAALQPYRRMFSEVNV